MSGFLNVAPTDTTVSAKKKKVFLLAERSNKTPGNESGVRNARRFPDWIRAKSASNLVAQMKGEMLMLVLPDTDDGFWSTIGALWSLDERR
jgi:hypothetical protein